VTFFIFFSAANGALKVPFVLFFDCDIIFLLFWRIKMSRAIGKEKKNNMTEGVIWRSILLFSLPLIAGNIMQQLYNTADSFIVGQFVGDTALASVGMSGTIGFFLMAFMWGASTGSGVVISRYFGANDRLNLGKAVHTTMILSVIIGAMVSVLGIVLAKPFLMVLGCPEDMMSTAILYIRIFFGGMIFNAIYNMAAGILNAVGNSRRTLLYLGISSITNIVLDLLFVAVFRWGVAGAAIATCVSQLISAILIVINLLRTSEPYGLRIKELRFDSLAARQIIRTGFPTAIQNAVLAFSNLLIQAGVNAYGTLAVAGFTACLKVDGFNILPVMSFSLAATTFVGQNIGAGRMDRVKKGTVTAMVMCIIYSAVISMIMIIFRTKIISIFSESDAVVEYGVQCLMALAPFYVLLAVIHSLAGAVRGSGHTVPPMVIILISLCAYRVAWIEIAAPLFGSIIGVYLTYSTSFFVGAALMVIYTLRGKWLIPKTYGENRSPS